MRTAPQLIALHPRRRISQRGLYADSVDVLTRVRPPAPEAIRPREGESSENAARVVNDARWDQATKPLTGSEDGMRN